ncbi:hypothetical protein ACFOY4_24190 [Actinomadura syzygii]|uniref:Uncharacterized protein n=1 Tax=Actinomadura syzygii TaxID=1427538 RepID=A0A5D0UIZ5_9ACTN|nr:hypothetical protein [Actinomadura syzygii]TYC18471.1 hypothetical protein FXF65_01535 [Actinomadura syzygii]
MSHRPFYPAGNEEFAADLRRLHSDCGEPTYSSVIRIIPQLDELFPLKHGRLSLPTSLSRSNISQLLNGARQASAAPLAVLVLCFLRCAAENGSIRTDPATGAPLKWEAILRAWQKRLRRARQQDDVRAASPAPNPSASSDDQSSVMPSMALADPGTKRRSADPVHLEPGELAVLGAHGAYGGVLAEQAKLGDPEAIYQLAVALAFSPEYRSKAVAYLLNAGPSHPAALGLLQESEQSIDPRHARTRAESLAEMAKAYGYEAAMHFFRSWLSRLDLADRPVTVEGDEAH